MILKPLFDRVLLIEEEKSENAKTGIILPNSADELPHVALVTAIGSGGIVDGKPVEMKVNVGDKVLFNKYCTTEFKHNDKTFLLIKQCDILAILE